MHSAVDHEAIARSRSRAGSPTSTRYSSHPPSAVLRPRDPRQGGGRVTSEDVEDVLLRGMVMGMAGVSLLYKGRKGVDDLNNWSKVATAGRKLDEQRHRFEDQVEEHLEIDLHEAARQIDYKSKVLASVEAFKTLITDVNVAVTRKDSSRARARVLELGGGDLTVAATRFIKEEGLLELCVDTIWHLTSNADARRYLLKDRVDCTEALAQVLGRPHKAIVVQHVMGGLSNLCNEHGVTNRVVKLGALNAVIKLTSTVAPSFINVLRSCAHLAQRMAIEPGSARVMASRSDEVATAMLRIVKVCDDDDAVCDSAGCLANMCGGSNRITFGRHRDLDGLSTALERCARNPSTHKAQAGALCLLVEKLAGIKEIRARLLSIGAGEWLVSLVFSHMQSLASAEAAATAVRILEVDDEGAKVILSIVRRFADQVHIKKGGGAASSAPSGSSISLPGSNKGGERVHWTLQVLSAHVKVPWGEGSAVSMASSSRRLMERYLHEQLGEHGNPRGGDYLQIGGATAALLPETPLEPATPAEPATPSGSAPPSTRYGTPTAPPSEAGTVTSRRLGDIDEGTSSESVILPSLALQDQGGGTTSASLRTQRLLAVKQNQAKMAAAKR